MAVYFHLAEYLEANGGGCYNHDLTRISAQ